MLIKIYKESVAMKWFSNIDTGLQYMLLIVMGMTIEMLAIFMLVK
ncbi:hypothetical protein THIOSC13_80009 [uncultured Thiomicrorhabdus sp.]|jgi:hypothetical protein